MPQIIEITDYHAPELDVFARLNERELIHLYDPLEGLFIAESPNVILRALNGGYQPVSLLMEHRHIEGQGREIIARCPETPVYVAPLEVLTKLTGFPLTRGILCGMRRRPLPDPEEICAGAHRVAVLEDIMNPTNIGAIIRSAAALHMDAVLLTPSCCDPLYRRSVRVSMGTIFQIPWTVIGKTAADWPGAGMAFLREQGFRTVAMALRDDSLTPDDPRLRAEEKLAVILGTEGDGLSSATIASCDYTVKIPMAHGVDSLNVAAASAVAFWELGNR
ncbi:MAG: RNA methyltransferase [Clostridia bacterium]|nr:RNA methyltransferase [Clostridia bacterium]